MPPIGDEKPEAPVSKQDVEASHPSNSSQIFCNTALMICQCKHKVADLVASGQLISPDLRQLLDYEVIQGQEALEKDIGLLSRSLTLFRSHI